MLVAYGQSFRLEMGVCNPVVATRGIREDSNGTRAERTLLLYTTIS